MTPTVLRVASYDACGNGSCSASPSVNVTARCSAPARSRPWASRFVSGLYQALGHELQRVAHPRVVTRLPAHPLTFLDRLEVHSVRLRHDPSSETGRIPALPRSACKQ